MLDVGTGGVDGFRWEDPIKTETYYYKGGHGAALTHDNLPRLAAFVMDGTNGQPNDLVPEPSGGFSMLSRAAPHLARLLAVLLLAGAITLAARGPWAVPVNAAVLIGAAVTVLVILDLV
jgi:hypothetical protein